MEIILKKLSYDDVSGNGINATIIDKSHDLAINLTSKPSFNPFETEPNNSGVFFSNDFEYQVYNPKDNVLYLSGNLKDNRSAKKKAVSMNKVSFSLSVPNNTINFNSPIFKYFHPMLKALMTSTEFVRASKKIDDHRVINSSNYYIHL